MADFPEDGVEIFPGYIPPRRARVAAALDTASVSAIDPLAMNSRAREVNGGRRAFLRLLRQELLETAITQLGLAGNPDGIYQSMLVKREFGVALAGIGGLVLDTGMPTVTLDQMRAALTTSTIEYFDDRTPTNVPDGARHAPIPPFARLAGLAPHRRDPEVAVMPVMLTQGHGSAARVPAGMGDPDPAHLPDSSMPARIRRRPDGLLLRTPTEPSRHRHGHLHLAGTYHRPRNPAGRNHPGQSLVPPATHHHR